MKFFIKEFFTYKKSERNGLLVLLFLFGTIIIVFPLSTQSKIKSKYDTNEFVDRINTSNFNLSRKNVKKKEINNRTVSMFKFDPNNTTIEDWLKLGLKKWQIKVVNSYLEKANGFKSKEQFLGLDIFSKEDSVRLDKYVFMQADTIFTNTIFAKGIIELNSCSSDQLRLLKGIGYSYSSRIIEYRDALGGYYNISQLYEVYGLDSIYCDSIFPFIQIDTTLLSKININKCPARILYNHPYVNWNVANAIVNYRDQHGCYKFVSDIQNTDLVNPDLYRKIAPYFSLVE